ncbi:hypothetical protein Nmel_013275 [Mimus melanotis]
MELRALEEERVMLPLMELQKEPQALHLQAVKSITSTEGPHRQTWQVPAAPSQSRTCPQPLGSGDTERSSALPGPSQRLLGNAAGLLTPFPASSERDAPFRGASA